PVPDHLPGRHRRRQRRPDPPGLDGLRKQRSSVMARHFFAPGFAPTRPRFRSQRPALAPSRPRYRLYLEILESRCVPSTVTNLVDAGPGSLRNAIATTPSGGTVDFQPGLSGTITLRSGELIIAKDLTVAGPGSSMLTVSGNHAERVFYITALGTVTISGLTIAHGTGDSGCGIENFGALTVTDSVIRDNTCSAYYPHPSASGGIDNKGTMTLVDSVIANNTGGLGVTLYAGPVGGGVLNTGTMIIVNSVIRQNRADFGSGGGVANVGSLTITGSS